MKRNFNIAILIIGLSLTVICALPGYYQSGNVMVCGLLLAGYGIYNLKK